MEENTNKRKITVTWTNVPTVIKKQVVIAKTTIGAKIERKIKPRQVVVSLRPETSLN